LKPIRHYAPVILAACFSLQAVGIGIYISYGVFFNSLITEFQWPRALVSGASSLAFFISGVMAVLIGKINDTMGPRKVMMATALFFGAGFMALSRLEHIWQLYLFFGIIFGIGLSSVDVIALSTVARWFPHRRGFMTGITKVGTGAGQLTFPLLASSLIVGFGWRRAFLIIGAAAIVLLLTIALALKKKPDTVVRESDETLGSPDSNNLTFSQAAKTAQLWLLCIVNMIVLVCLMSVMVHIAAHAKDIGMTAYKSAGVLSAIGAASMIGRFITGMIIDRIGSKRAMVLSLVILLIGLVVLNTTTAFAMLYLFAFIYGFAHGSYFTVLSPIVAEYFGLTAHGALFGLMVFFGCTGGAAGPIMTGYLFDTFGSYSLPFLLFLLFSGAGLLLIFFLKPIQPASTKKTI
jgi:MFS family permease